MNGNAGAGGERRPPDAPGPVEAAPTPMPALEGRLAGSLRRLRRGEYSSAKFRGRAADAVPITFSSVAEEAGASRTTVSTQPQRFAWLRREIEDAERERLARLEAAEARASEADPYGRLGAKALRRILQANASAAAAIMVENAKLRDAFVRYRGQEELDRTLRRDLRRG